MNRQERSTLESLQRVQQFLAQYPVGDSPDALGAQAAELKDVIARLSSDAVDQEAGDRFVRVHVDAQRKLRQTLYMDHMQPISRVAREIFGVTGMDKAFRLPRNIKVNQVLIAAAGAMAEAAEKEKTMFVRHGLAENFVDALEAAAKALDEARQAQRDSGRRRVGATAAVQDQVKRGRKAVRLLDAILKPRLARDAQLVAAWRSAKRARPIPCPDLRSGERTVFATQTATSWRPDHIACKLNAELDTRPQPIPRVKREDMHREQCQNP